MVMSVRFCCLICGIQKIFKSHAKTFLKIELSVKRCDTRVWKLFAQFVDSCPGQIRYYPSPRAKTYTSHYQLNVGCFVPCKGMGILEYGKFYLVESKALEFAINLKESGIPLRIGIQNPISTLKESGYQYSAVIRNLQRGTCKICLEADCLAMDYLTCVSPFSFFQIQSLLIIDVY